MRRFIEMCDQVSSQGLLTVPGLEEKVKKLGISPKDMEGDFFKYASESSQFVFLPKFEKTQAPPEPTDPTDPPFPVFSIEMSGDNFITTPDGLSILKNENAPSIRAILVVEYAPKRYVYYLLLESKGVRGVLLDFSKEVGGLVQHYIDRINSEKMGLESVRVKMKIGSGKSKKRHEIRRVIHVSKSPVRVSDGSGSREIDWSHRFEVRGHWRRPEGVGKDREGNYCVEGYTWVREHVRGPEHLPLVKKTRVVLSE